MKKAAKPRTRGGRVRNAAACDAAAAAARDRELGAAVAAWFAREGRDLPWRRPVGGGRRDPWRSLVSEIMLQQTQVSRVLERYEGFMAEFPTPAAMAAAGEAAVLARWSGMGYYRRARLLFAAAREIVERFGGRVPMAVADLRSLPGVGRYTAGAVASLVFGACEPIVDGNIARVLLRVHGREMSAAEASAWCWERAEALARAAGGRVAGANEGLMELGAVVCTPKAPRCGRCPLKGRCDAEAGAMQDRIPRPKRAPVKSGVLCEVVVVRDGAGRVLVERRGLKGMWAGLWQAPTLERPGAETPRGGARTARELGLVGARVGEEAVEEFLHETTHRSVRFVVYAGRARAGAGAAIPAGHGAQERRWAGGAEVGRLGISNAQRRILAREAGLFG